MDNNDGFVIPPNIYNFLKWVALVVLPALAALILGLGITLHWSVASDVAGVVTLVDTFLGAILGKSSSNYKSNNNMGDLVVQQYEDGSVAGMKVVNGPPNPILKEGGQVTMTVKREQSSA